MTLALMLLALPAILRPFGWHITTRSGEVGPSLVLHGRPVSECLNIIYLNLTPLPQEVRLGCIAQYAFLKHDPAACELLMPSWYGVECVAVIRSSIIGDYCAKRKEDSELSCVTGGRVSVHPVPNIDHCEKYDDVLVRDWCYKERSFRLPVDDCEQISTPIRRDACRADIANREKDEALCDRVEHAGLRSACRVLVKAFREHPELQQS